MRATISGVFASLVLICAATPTGAADPPPKTVVLTRLVNEAASGERRATIRGAVGCIRTDASGTLPAVGEIDVAPYQDAFRKALLEAGLHPQQAASLFETDRGSGASYAIAGILRGEVYDLCVPNFLAVGPKDMNGRGTMTIEWQLYSRLENRVVARARIVSNFSTSQTLKGGLPSFQAKAMEENFKLLAADAGIRAALAGPAAGADAAIKPTSQPPIIIEGARAATPKSIDQASQSVVVIYAGDGTGSGVLVSRDGYILTDAHVVGDAASVRLRWADGKTSIATVLRSSRQRDVALLKVDAAGHDPLPLKETPPPVGSTVFCIGAPEGQQFQGTLTRGVVSSMRVMEGLNYIQSDVTTGHGGSGGPLLDEKGYVIGLTVLAVGRDTTSSGLNFFTPVKDAIDFLGLELR